MCNHEETEVVDSRWTEHGKSRRRQCLACGERFNTLEVREDVLNGAAERFEQMQRQVENLSVTTAPTTYIVLVPKAARKELGL